MKQASTAAQAILSSGSFIKTDLYVITLTTGASYYFTNGDVQASTFIYPSGTLNSYLKGFTFIRDTTSQSVGLDAQELDLKIFPQWDNPGGPPTIAGYTISQAARLGLLDNATILYAKLFQNDPLDFTPGAVGWYSGVTASMDITRYGLNVKVSSDILVLNQVQMPRALYQPGCVHTVYDAGCTLLKSSFTYSGTTGTVTSNSLFNSSGLSQADHYFDLGVVKFTSGLNTGYSASVKSYIHTSGVIQLSIPMPSTIHAGDTFTVYPGCDHQQSTCTNKFANLIHFKGMPYVPVPETLYDGGTSNPPNSVAPANQAGNLIGSRIGGSMPRN